MASNQKAPESNIEWEKWGEIDPLWGVASWAGREKDSDNPWTNEEFYSLGKSDWEHFQSRWQKYGVDRGSCLEIGCGAGRITMHLGKFFDTVYGVDVSENMVAYARQHVANPNTTFFKIDGTQLPKDEASVAAVFSTYVFQHFDSLDYATLYFKEIYRILKPGGTFMIQVPLFEWHPATPGVFKAVFELRKSLGHVRAWLQRRLIRQGLAKPIMRGLVFPLSYFYTTLPDIGFQNIEVQVFALKDNTDLHPFIFARKP